MWDGHLNQPSRLRLQAVLKDAHVPLVHHHTSGHASPQDLARLVAAYNPKWSARSTPTPPMSAPPPSVPLSEHADGVWWPVQLTGWACTEVCRQQWNAHDGKGLAETARRQFDRD